MLFWGLALLLLLAMILIRWQVPRWNVTVPDVAGPKAGYAEVWKHSYFRKMTPIGFFCYGGLVAIQTLWATPWMIKVGGYSAAQAASGLFWINISMLCAFWTWGMVNPWLVRHGYDADWMIARGLPLSFLVLAALIVAGPSASTLTGALWALYCVTCTFVTLAQPAVGMAFASAVAGRALSAYNLVVFAGVFVVQWGIGLAVDGFKALGWSEVQAFQSAMSVFLLCSVLSYFYFLAAKSHNRRT